VEAIMLAYAHALMVDRKKLNEAQVANDVAMAQEILQNTFRTDIRAIVAEARLRLGGALDPIGYYRENSIRLGLIKERGSKTIATGL
jgi:L-rhamnose isomerase/sugar isomerase